LDHINNRVFYTVDLTLLPGRHHITLSSTLLP